MPVLLAYHGKQDETDCTGLIMNVDWPLEGGPHPLTYHAVNITEERVRLLRKPDLCDSAAALRLVIKLKFSWSLSL